MQRERAAAAVLLVLLAALAAVSSTSGAGGGGTVIRMQLSHADAGRGLTPGELLQRMALRSKTRAARFLSGSSASAPVTPGYPSTKEYLVHLGIGTPSSQPVQLVLDTGSDLTWTQCLPCSSAAAASSCFPRLCLTSTRPCPPRSSTSLATRRRVRTCCRGRRRPRQTAVPNLSFGCGLNNSGRSFTPIMTGIAGFGRGNLSLPSQLKVDNFSYCFTNNTSTSSPVLLGLPANLSGGASSGAAVQTTPLNTTSTFYYYLNLKSITVGSTTLQVPESAFALNADGTGGTIIDSGTSITLLPPHVFSLLSDAFVSELNMTPVAVTAQPDLLCFPASTTTMPKLQLQFEGATLDLPQGNYVFPQDNNTCIVILQSSGGNNMTIIGNYQQQNLHVLYDLAGNTISFVPAQCDKV
ncbi:unnamed protein product [Miscanthus lutarioriparius]|uniref:Peptidase A1 domain-containing protein n=1 Tax=Miscanthus lutarioriparius TaxID=422564 RepID=A0A811Q084_9POAL|nr:unnamed protein product [Miscanthus lutarioriparius]